MDTDLLSKRLLLDIVFMRTWYPVSIPAFYNPVTSLLKPVGEKDTWSGMRTTHQLRLAHGIKLKPNKDSLYKVQASCVCVSRQHHTAALFAIFLVFVVLEIKPSALHMLSKCDTSEQTHQPYNVLFMWLVFSSVKSGAEFDLNNCIFAVLETEQKNGDSGFLRIGNEIKTLCKIFMSYLRITDDIVICMDLVRWLVTYCGWSSWAFLPFHPLAQKSTLQKSQTQNICVSYGSCVYHMSSALDIVTLILHFCRFYIFWPLSPCSCHSFCFLWRNACWGLYHCSRQVVWRSLRELGPGFTHWHSLC